MSSSGRSDTSLFLLTALSLSIGWGIRGNFGHEFGAMIPGALAAMAAVLLSGRDDWRRRIAFFGFFGALGWSFGGSISYMQVIGYTHSGHSPSVLYGFACLFVIGFLWAAMGGAGTALPVFLDRRELTGFFPPLSAVFIAWWLQDIGEAWFIRVSSEYRQESPLYWYDTDWLAALLAIVSVLVFALIQRRWSSASSLVLHMALGWWIGFLLLVIALGLRMTPPRGDNWAGCVGMVGGMLVYFWRRGWTGLMFATLVTGFVGGFGFAVATLLKLIEIRSGADTNWHSVLEQTYGLINGLGIALAISWLARRAPKVDDEPPDWRWTEAYAVGFILVGITWLNLRRIPGDLIQRKLLADSLSGLPTNVWFDLGYALLAVCIVCLLMRHLHRPLPCVPSDWLGKGQLLYLVFLWWVVVGNLGRALTAFTAQRLVTEGVIQLNAMICTLLVVLCPGRERTVDVGLRTDFGLLARKVLALGIAGFVLTTAAEWRVVRAIYGDQFAGYAGKHIRFGPNATTGNPPPGSPHP